MCAGRRREEGPVFEAGVPSWRFTVSEGDLLDLALAVRDGCGLPVPGGPAVPPPLVDVPAPVGDLTPEERQEAARQWAVWWADLVQLVVRRTQSDQDDSTDLAAWAADRAVAGSPPDFAGLVDRPELRRAVRATADARRTRPDRRRAIPTGAFAHDLVRRVAEDVAFDRAVSPDRVSGSAVVLDVQGPWWHEAGPGVVLCSRAAAQDPAVAHQVLRRAYESGLRRA
jgi:hypothetical protein